MQANERVSYIANRPNPASGKVVEDRGVTHQASFQPFIKDRCDRAQTASAWHFLYVALR